MTVWIVAAWFIGGLLVGGFLVGLFAGQNPDVDPDRRGQV